jgi:hypothetical protein
MLLYIPFCLSLVVGQKEIVCLLLRCMPELEGGTCTTLFILSRVAVDRLSYQAYQIIGLSADSPIIR